MSFRLVALLLAVSAPGWGQWSGNAKRIQGVPVSPQRPTDGQSLVYNELQKMWVPTTLSGGGGSAFPLVDSGAREDGYRAISMEYLIGDTCTEGSYCDVRLLRGTIQGNSSRSYNAVLYDLSVWQPDGTTGISTSAETIYDPSEGGWGNANYSLTGGAGPSGFSKSCSTYFFSGGSAAMCATSVSSTSGNVEAAVSADQNKPLLSVTGGMNTFLNPENAAYRFHLDARSAPAGFTAVSITAELSQDDGPANFLGVGPSAGYTFRVATDGVHVSGTLALSETQSGSLPACSADRSGTIANVRTDADNTAIFVCVQTAGTWQWVPL